MNETLPAIVVESQNQIFTTDLTITMPSATATVSDTTLASSDSYETVEGNIYFPPSSVSKEYFKPSATQSACPWKGLASYYNVVLDDGTEIKDAAWYYPAPKDAAKHIKDHVAFCKL
jgi:uncharacterized protein (DUF427 family)